MAFMPNGEVEPIRYARARRYRRFDLQLPVCLSFPSAGTTDQLTGFTKNVSLGGLLLESVRQLPLRTQVDVTIGLVTPWSSRPIQLRTEGEIVRVEALDGQHGFALAIECKRPIKEMGDHLRIAS